MKVVDRYLLREFLVPLVASIGFFLFALVMDKLFDLLDLVFNRGVSAWTVLRLLGCLVPSIVAISLPMATLLAAILSFGRLAQDQELTALKASGVGLGRLMAPLAAAGAIFSAALVVFNGTVLPAANLQYKAVFFDIVQQKASVALKERVFIREFDRYVLYFNKKEGKEGVLRDVTVIETPPVPPRIILARTGRLEVDPAGYNVELRLDQGSLDQTLDLKGERYSRIDFGEYRVALDIHNALTGGGNLTKGISEMTYGDLARKMHETRNLPDLNRSYAMELHQRLAVALAPLLVIFVGAPLGALARRGGGIGLVLSLVVIALYYFCQTVGQGLADHGTLSVPLALWSPDVLLGLLGLIAYWAASTESRWIRWGR